MASAVFYCAAEARLERAAAAVARAYGPMLSGCFDVAAVEPTDLLEYAVLILGVSPGRGPGGWAALLPRLRGLDFRGHRVAFFGPGGAAAAQAEVWDVFRSGGAELVGRSPAKVGPRGPAGRPHDQQHHLGLVLDDGVGDQSEQLSEWAFRLRRQLRVSALLARPALSA